MYFTTNKPNLTILMNLTRSILTFCAGLSLFTSCTSSDASNANEQPENSSQAAVLVFSKTSGYVHASIPDGVAAVQQLGRENDIRVDTTKNAAYFTADSLEKYDAVIFLSTTGDVLNEEQQEAFENYIKGGGGFAGVHAATDTEYEWPWYNRLVGAYFESHPETQKAIVRVIDHSHPATEPLPEAWERTDEWYNFKDVNPDIQVLAILDETSYSGGTNGENHPIIWHHAFEGGRAFYTAGGHTPESFQDPLFLQHLLGGIQYAMGR